MESTDETATPPSSPVAPSPPVSRLALTADTVAIVRWSAFSMVLGGVGLALAWYLVAPRGLVVVRPDFIYALQVSELMAQRDLAFGACALGIGLLHGIASVFRVSPRPSARVVAAVFAGLVGSGLGYALAYLVGPGLPSVSHGGPVPPPQQAPFVLGAIGLLCVWPAVVALIQTVYFATAWSDPMRRQRRDQSAAGQPAEEATAAP